jgi:proteasome lid subunit RPN8/RPN11
MDDFEEHWSDVRDVEDEPEEFGEESVSPGWRRVLAVFLAFLFITYLLVDPRVRQAVVGLTESSTVDDERFRYEDKVVAFQDGSWGELQETWESTQDHEFRVCLTGRVRNGTYAVTDVYHPDVYQESVYHVRSGACPATTIVDLHSHPYQQCVASQTDLDHIEQVRDSYPDRLLAVMCTRERISFY